MRARNINPGLFINEILGTEDPLITILFSGLWCLADREGRLEDRPRKIHAGVFPYRSTSDVDTNSLLDRLQNHGFITRYQIDGASFIQIANWHKYQSPHHMETPSTIPPPDGVNNKFNHTPISKLQRERIFHRDKEKCKVCGSSTNLHIDHIIPVSRGGDSDDSNLRTLCEKCNCSKGSKPDDEWMMDRGKIDIESMSSRCRVDVESSGMDLVPLIPDSLIPDSLIPDTSNNTLPPPKGGAAVKKPGRVPSWKTAFPEDITEAMFAIMDIWPDSKKDIQPKKCAADPSQYVPESHPRFVADRLVAIQQEGADLAICVEIAKEYVKHYREGRNWVKAAEYFFGKTEDAKWKVYYKAHITNLAIQEQK